MPKQKIAHAFNRTFAGIGYFTCMLQWLWLAVLLMPILIEAGILTTTPPPPEPIVSQNDGGSPSPIFLVLGGIVTVTMIVITLVAFYKLPTSVAKAGETLTHKTADVVVPVVARHAKLPAKKRRQLTVRVVMYIKFALCVLPLIALLFVPPVAELDHDLAIMTGAFLGVVSLGSFAIGELLLKASKPAHPHKKAH